MMSSAKIYKEFDYPSDSTSSLSSSIGDKLVCPFSYPTTTHPNTTFLMKGFETHFQIDSGWCLRVDGTFGAIGVITSIE